jgi:hypothetical protein
MRHGEGVTFDLTTFGLKIASDRRVRPAHPHRLLRIYLVVVTTVAPLGRALRPPSGWPPPRSGLPLAELAAPG